MAAAETGSGKTGAFALPILQLVHETLTARQHKFVCLHHTPSEHFLIASQSADATKTQAHHERKV